MAVELRSTAIRGGHPGISREGRQGMLSIVRIVLVYVLSIYLILLIGRLIITWIQQFSRSWSPSGIVLVIAEAVFTTTDPPLRLLRRYIPPLRLGRVALDLSFMLLILVIYVLLLFLHQPI